MRVKEFFDRLAEDFDSLVSIVDTAPWARWAWRVAEKEIGKASGCFIVDLGTGTGLTVLNLLRFTHNATFLSIDFSPNMIRKARAKNYGGASVEFRVQRIDQLRLPPHSVDHFVSYGTFHHIQNKVRIIRNLSTMLKPGGKFVNIDLFRPGSLYLAQMEKLRRANPAAAAENDRRREELQWIYDCDLAHPREFHVDPYQFRDLLDNAGLSPAKVHVSLQPGFAVVVGTKARGNNNGS